MEKTIKIPQMKKGKGYISYNKTSSDKPVTYGDPLKVIVSEIVKW